MDVAEVKYTYWLSWIFRGSVTGGFIYWFVANVVTAETIRAVVSVGPVAFAIALLLHTLALLLGGIRWWILLRHTSRSVKFVHILPSYYIGVLLNNVLPSSVGGDIARTVHLGFRGWDMKTLAGSAIIDRALGMFITLILGYSAFLLISDQPLGPWSIVLGLTMAFGALVLFSERFSRLVQWLAERYRTTRVRAFLLEVVHVCHSYRSANTAMLVSIAITLLMQSLVIITYYVLARPLGITLPLITYFAIVPVVFLAASIPISVGGLGVRESTLLVLLTTAGADRQSAGALSIAFLLVLWLTSLPGAIAILKSGAKTPLQSAHSNSRSTSRG